MIVPATVSQASPLRVLIDGASSDSPAMSSTTFLVDDRVYVFADTTPLLVSADASGLVLGTAATRDVGTTNGTIPVLGAGGRLAIARLASGAPDGTQFIRDDGTLAVPPATPPPTFAATYKWGVGP